MGTGLSALLASRNGSRIRAIYVNFSGENVVTCVVKRGEEMVFCTVNFGFEKYTNFSNFFFAGYSFGPRLVRRNDQGRLERLTRRRW